MDKPQQQVNVHAEREHLRGRYANLIVATAQEREVVIDFIAQVRRGPSNEGELVARVFLHHYTADQLFELLQNLRKQWEEKQFKGSTTTGEPSKKEN